MQRGGVRCGAQAKPPESMAIQARVLIDRAAVAVAVAVLLIEGKLESRAAGKTNWFAALWPKELTRSSGESSLFGKLHNA